MGRNTPLLREIIEVLADQVFNKEQALHDLEDHFDHRLLVNAGDVQTVALYAEQLRLRVAREECDVVLDYIASKAMVGITIDNVEDAINTLLGQDRFIEP